MAINQEIRNDLPENTLVFDNASYDNSIIGVSFDGKAIYLFEKMVKEYMQDNDCDEICAVEWIEYNTIRSLPYFGEKSPIIVYGEWSDAYDCIIADIDDAPTADVAIVKHAKWIGKNSRDYYTCSNCCVVAKSKDDAYCPNCGAKMDGGKAE